MKKYKLLTLLLLSGAAIFSQNLIQYATTNPDYGNDVYGSPVQQVERSASGKIFVYGGYNELSDNFNGLTTGETRRNRFLAAYSASGSIEWVRGAAFVSSLHDRLKTAPNGDAVLGFSFYDSARIGNVKFLGNPPFSDVAFGRYDASGNFLGAFQLGMSGTHNRMYDFEIASNGDLLVLLATDAPGIYQNLTFPFDPALPYSLLAARFSPAGNLVSVLRLGAAPYVFGNFSLEILPNGDWVAGGHLYVEGLQWGGQNIAKAMSAVGRWSPFGNLIWTKEVASTGVDCSIFDLAADPTTGDVAFTGSYSGQLLEGSPRDHTGYHSDVLVGKMSGADGRIRWSRSGDDDSNFSELGYKTAVDAAGNVFAAGLCKGGLHFDGEFGLCSSGPYQQAFLVKFDDRGSYSWGVCDGNGFTLDLALMPAPDFSVFTVGSTAAGVSWSNTNFFNHWENRSLLLAPLEKAKYCSGDTVQLNWVSVGGSPFPAGASVKVSLRDSANNFGTATFPALTVPGTSGSVRFVLPHDFAPSDEPISLHFFLTIGSQNSAQTEPFKYYQTPVPSFNLKPLPACTGRTDLWLKPIALYKTPHLVAWEPAAKFEKADSIAARLLLVEPDVFFKATFRDTVSGCSASDSLQLELYDFSLHVAGPEHIFGAANLTYHAQIGGTQWPPMSFDWSDNLPQSGSAFNAFYVNDTILAGATVTDGFGCRRADSLLIVFEPPHLVFGRAMNHDSTMGMPFVRVEFYQKDAVSGGLELLAATGTDAEGNFRGNIRNTTADTVLWLRVVPDSVLHPLDAPTWFLRKYFAQNADPASIADDSTFLPNMRLLHSQMLPDSNGLISGNIEKLLLGAHQGTAASSGPEAGLLLWLADADGQPLRYTVTDASGFFKFDHLPFGKFYLLVDKLGIDNSLAPSVTISAQRPRAENLTGLLSTKQLFINAPFVNAADLAGTAADWRIAPNPVSGEVLSGENAEFPNREIEIALFDATGRLIFSRTILTDGRGRFLTKLPALASGFYFLKIGRTGVLKRLEIVR